MRGPAQRVEREVRREAGDRERDVELAAEPCDQQQHAGVDDEANKPEGHHADRERQQPDDRLDQLFTSPRPGRGRSAAGSSPKSTFGSSQVMDRERDRRSRPSRSMNPLIWFSSTPSGRRRPTAGDHGRIAASAAQRFLEASLDRRPLVVDHAVPGGVPDAAAGHDHVLAEDPLERRADAEQGRPRLLVVRVGLELDPPAAERLERVARASAASPRDWRRSAARAARATSSRSPAGDAPGRCSCTGCCRSAGRSRRRSSRTGSSVPASRAAIVDGGPLAEVRLATAAGRSSSARSPGRARPRRGPGRGRASAARAGRCGPRASRARCGAASVIAGSYGSRVASTTPQTRLPSPPPEAAVSDFSARVDAFLAEYFALHPLAATSAGMHDHDGRWPDLTEAGRGPAARLLRPLDGRARRLDDAALPTDERIDRDLLLGELDAHRFGDVDLREETLEPARLGLPARRRHLPADRPRLRAARRSPGVGRRPARGHPGGPRRRARRARRPRRPAGRAPPHREGDRASWPGIAELIDDALARRRAGAAAGDAAVAAVAARGSGRPQTPRGRRSPAFETHLRDVVLPGVGRARAGSAPTCSRRSWSTRSARPS